LEAASSVLFKVYSFRGEYLSKENIYQRRIFAKLRLIAVTLKVSLIVVEFGRYLLLGLYQGKKCSKRQNSEVAPT